MGAHRLGSARDGLRSDGPRSPCPGFCGAYLDNAHPRLPPGLVGEDGLPDRYARYYRDLVHRHLAIQEPAEPGGDGGRLTIHPDIVIALRLTDRPAPVDHAQSAITGRQHRKDGVNGTAASAR
ncbi:hypothetical protein Vau01_122460 [Virgisporangium aurantiacum]|uniref:Uncharacterized protein n=1 Tax=Virgisporangium aurantiacum TaxID=175570 RepID=A0A8J3ZNK4_9ACTN|nr:hypothetical protein Vau01_122460 [Virgisporangium aurantiacum]